MRIRDYHLGVREAFKKEVIFITFGALSCFILQIQFFFLMFYIECFEQIFNLLKNLQLAD